MTMQFTSSFASHFELQHEGVILLRYVYNPQTAPLESPRPYIHPLRTLQGHVVSDFRPPDHAWHHGLSMTSAYLSGHNFWGGPTYMDGRYQQLDNNGSQNLEKWSASEQAGTLNHDLQWRRADGEVLLAETRQLKCTISPDQDYWQLEWSSRFTGLGNEPLHWGSPTTQGRENAGYGGLFWRGPHDMEGGQILLSEGREGPDLMGQSSPWLAYIGTNEGTGAASTLLFIDNPTNPRHPTPWFVRNTTPMVCPNFAFAQEYVQPAGETLSLNYKILIADGAWGRERIEAEVKSESAKTLKSAVPNEI